MKLTLLRHAIALDKLLGMNDFDRPLTEKGRLKCIRYLEEHYETLKDIDYILCSPTVRTRQTCGLLCSVINIDPKHIIEDKCIYDFGDNSQEFLEMINACPNDKQHICFIGHNGSISSFASYLLEEDIHMKKGTIIQTIL